MKFDKKIKPLQGFQRFMAQSAVKLPSLHGVSERRRKEDLLYHDGLKHRTEKELSLFGMLW